jgi:hypothetical protein
MRSRKPALRGGCRDENHPPPERPLTRCMPLSRWPSLPDLKGGCGKKNGGARNYKCYNAK